jgi:hypothetical protein
VIASKVSKPKRRQGELRCDSGDQCPEGKLPKSSRRPCVREHTPNENKMSDGWRDGAWLRVEGGIS